MVHLKQLEKALEASITEGKIGTRESIIDEFLNENDSISSSASGKLHDVLYRIWTSDEVQKQIPTKEPETELTLTPIHSGSDEPTTKSRNEELFRSADPRVIFLEALNRLGPCLVNKEQLQMWWDSLVVYAIDSTGYRLDLVNQSKQFISGVLTGSFYEYGDSSKASLYSELSCCFGRADLQLYLSNKLPEDARGELTDERIRFVRQNCRTFFGQFARREIKAAFTMLNEYFIQPRYRIDVLDLVVEYLSESQNSKLFRVYDTPFFESLLNCLEKDRSRLAVQLALTALSMLIVHICDKLVTANLLFRIYACFGRACSWQPTRNQPDDLLDNKDNERFSNLSGDKSQNTTRSASPASIVSSSGNDAESGNSAESQSQSQKSTSKLSLQSSKEPKSTYTTTLDAIKKSPSKSSDTWKVLEDEALEPSGLGFNAETVDVIPLFTFLYGLFPINTLKFCRQCDEYFVNHGYQKHITDFWSRFMVTRKAESMIREFRVDPMLIMSTEDAELTNALSHFQEVGSALGLSNICTSRRIVDVSNNGYFSGDSGNENMNRLLNDHRQAFQMQPEGTAGHWHRELLLIRNEVAFANFSRNMSEQRALRWQKRSSDRSIMEIRNEELTRQNRILRAKVNNLESETQRAVRSARTIMRERSAYESKILDRNREFREKIKDLEEKVRESEKYADSARREIKETEQIALENQNRATEAETQAKALRNELEFTTHEVAVSARKAPGTRPNNSNNIGSDSSVSSSSVGSGGTTTEDKALISKLESDISTLKFSMERLKKDNESSLKALQAEVLKAQGDFASARLATPRPKPADSSKSPRTIATVIKDKNATINRLKYNNEELSRRCAVLEHELRARKVHEEERLNELQAALTSSRPYVSQDVLSDNRFRGRGGAQGVPRRI